MTAAALIFMGISGFWSALATLAIRELSRKHDSLARRVAELESWQVAERNTVAGLDAGLGKIVVACQVLAKAQGFDVGEAAQPTVH